MCTQSTDEDEDEDLVAAMTAVALPDDGTDGITDELEAILDAWEEA